MNIHRRGLLTGLSGVSLAAAASHEDVHTHVPYRLYDLCSGPSVSRTNDHFPQQNFLSHRYEIVCLPIQLDTIL